STHATSRLGDYVLTKGEYYGWSNTKHEAGGKDAFMQSLIPGKVFSASFEQDSVFINSRDDLAKANIELNDELNYNAEAVITFSFSL
ncbi:TPA: type 1 fimbrial protein, partial [Providencia stuartii]